MDHWLIDSAYRTHGTNFLLPDVIDTLLEFDFNHADLKYIEREAFNTKSIPKTWGKLANKLEKLVKDAESAGRKHSAFHLRHRYIFALLRSWTHGQEQNSAKELWQKINSEYDKATEYLHELDQVQIKRVEILVSGEICHGLLRVPKRLDNSKLDVLIILPGMDMTKEYFPSLINSSLQNRNFATLTLDPPGHGYSFVCGTKLNESNYDELITNSIAWLKDSKNSNLNVGSVAVLGIGTSAVFAFRAASINSELAATAGFEGGFLFQPTKTLADQSSMRLKKLATMTGLKAEQIAGFLEQVSLSNMEFNSKVPIIFSVGEFDDLFLFEQSESFISKMKAKFSLNMFEGEGHVLGKVINESLALTLDQIEESFQGNHVSLQGYRLIEKR